MLFLETFGTNGWPIRLRPCGAPMPFTWRWRTALARHAAREENTHTIVLSGGVRYNRLLSILLRQELADFTVLQPRNLPAGVGGLSLGQTLIAAARG